MKVGHPHNLRAAALMGLVALAMLGTTLLAPQRAEAQRKSLLKPGRVEVGTNLAGYFSSTTVEPEEGDKVEQSQSYFNPSLYFGLTVIPNLQLRLLGGFQSIGSEVDGVKLQDSGTTAISLQAIYHLPLQDGFAIYAGAGGGGFFGTTEREVAGGLKAENSTNGGIFQLLLGVLSQPTDVVTLRAGLRFDTLFGSESPDEANEQFQDQSITNIQTLLEFSIGFRFGEGW